MMIRGAAWAPSPGALLPAPAGALEVPATPSSSGRRVRLSLVLPTYNERDNVAEMIRRLTEILAGPLDSDYELIVVDDDSPDGTWEVAQWLTARYPRVRVMRRRDERGLGSAVIRGWQAARGDVLAVIDADLQHPPEVTVELWREIERGADLAVASRHAGGGGVGEWSLVRRVLSRGAQIVGLLLLPGVLGRVSDPMSGYFMVRRAAVAGRRLSPLGYKILLEVIGRGGIGRIAEVGYVFRERAQGESKVTWRLYVDYLRHLGRLRLATLPLARFARFAAVGLSGLVIDMSVLGALSDPRALGWGLTEGKIVAAELAIANNFLWNDAWTFRDLAGGRRDVASKLGRFARFNAVCAVGLAVNLVLLNLMCGPLRMNRYLADAIAVGVVTMWNFWLNLRLSYGGRPAAE
jgi:dolichol-phosphate mannosyltransferase